MQDSSAGSDRTLALPRLIGARATVRALLEELGQIEGRDVVLNARDLRSASPSSADEFVKAILVEGGSRSLRVVGAGADFVHDLEQSASVHNVSDRLKTPVLK
jgi:hypothetical protein